MPIVMRPLNLCAIHNPHIKIQEIPLYIHTDSHSKQKSLIQDKQFPFK